MLKNIVLRKKTKISTFQRFNISTSQHFNMSILQPCNLATFQHFNISKFKHFNIETLNMSTSHHLKISIFQDFNISTFQHFQHFQHLKIWNHVWLDLMLNSWNVEIVVLPSNVEIFKYWNLQIMKSRVLRKQHKIRTFQHSNNSTCQHFNISTLQPFNRATIQRFNISKFQHSKISTQHFNIANIFDILNIWKSAIMFQ